MDIITRLENWLTAIGQPSVQGSASPDNDFPLLLIECRDEITRLRSRISDLETDLEVLFKNPTTTEKED